VAPIAVPVLQYTATSAQLSRAVEFAYDQYNRGEISLDELRQTLSDIRSMQTQRAMQTVFGQEATGPRVEVDRLAAEQQQTVNPWQQQTVAPWQQQTVAPWQQQTVAPWQQQTVAPWQQQVVNPWLQTTQSWVQEEEVAPSEVEAAGAEAGGGGSGKGVAVLPSGFDLGGLGVGFGGGRGGLLPREAGYWVGRGFAVYGPHPLTGRKVKGGIKPWVRAYGAKFARSKPSILKTKTSGSGPTVNAQRQYVPTFME
jgi:hypothetical protein